MTSGEGHHGGVPKPVTVWAVELGPDLPPDEIKGALALEGETLSFTPEREVDPPLSIPVASIAKVRRLRGSPVLMVVHGRGVTRRTAFYFAQPPPLGVLTGQVTERPPGGLAAFRNPRRRARRDNIGYLGAVNRAKKPQISEWVRAIRAAAAASRQP
jgi:hypothetical protein